MIKLCSEIDVAAEISHLMSRVQALAKVKYKLGANVVACLVAGQSR